MGGEGSGVPGLDASSDDIRALKARKRRVGIAKLALAGMAPIAGLATGYAIGVSTRPDLEAVPGYPVPSYPYAAAAVYAVAYPRAKPTMLGALVLAVLGFIFGIMITTAMPLGDPPAIMYSVYSRNQ